MRKGEKGRTEGGKRKYKTKGKEKENDLWNDRVKETGERGQKEGKKRSRILMNGEKGKEQEERKRGRGKGERFMLWQRRGNRRTRVKRRKKVE